MGSSNTDSGDVPASFIQQLLRNNILLLTVLLALGGTVYFAIGLYMLIGR